MTIVSYNQDNNTKLDGDLRQPLEEYEPLQLYHRILACHSGIWKYQTMAVENQID
jgi:hypothetical protein